MSCRCLAWTWVTHVRVTTRGERELRLAFARDVSFARVVLVTFEFKNDNNPLLLCSRGIPAIRTGNFNIRAAPAVPCVRESDEMMNWCAVQLPLFKFFVRGFLICLLNRVHCLSTNLISPLFLFREIWYCVEILPSTETPKTVNKPFVPWKQCRKLK